MNTGSYLKRTNETNVSEDELLILDVLFDAKDRFESLLRENYASWHNLPYTHKNVKALCSSDYYSCYGFRCASDAP
jgi:hypothetical protein